MGMSASQARFTELTARKSNVEYQGQQINQQRTVLANISAEYNNELLSLSVPTAPSEGDFTKTAYAFTNNGFNYTLEPLTDYNQNSRWGVPTYTVNCKYTHTGEQTESGKATFTGGVTNPVSITKHVVNTNTTYTGPNGEAITLVTQSGSPAKNNAADDAILKQLGIDNYSSTDQYYKYHDATLNKDVYIKGSVLAAMTGGDGTKATLDTHYLQYRTSDGNNLDTVDNSNESTLLKKLFGDDYDANKTYYKYEIGGVERYLSQDDLADAITQNKQCTYHDLNSQAQVSEEATYPDCFVQWDGTRMVSFKDLNTNITYQLSPTSVTDEDAYDAANKKYEYDKYNYEQQMNIINGKTSVVQQDDKNLELQLKQLDTEQEALSTEIDSVKKVIDKNIESSFKTFA